MTNTTTKKIALTTLIVFICSYICKSDELIINSNAQNEVFELLKKTQTKLGTDAENIQHSEISSTSSTSKLSSIFGINFNSVITDLDTVKEDSGSQFVEFTPKKQFKEFTVYKKYITPISKKVYKITATCYTQNPQKIYNETILILEKKYGIKSTPNLGTINFGESETIKLVKQNDSVVIIATNNDLLSTAKDERIITLAKPLQIEYTTTKSVSSIFSIEFGKELNSNFVKKSISGNFEFHPETKFLDFDRYIVFTTPTSQKASGIALYYSGDNFKTIFNNTKEILEHQFNVKFGANNAFIYKNLYCCLEINSEEKSILVRFIDLDMNELTEKEEEQKKIDNMDLDAL